MGSKDTIRGVPIKFGAFTLTFRGLVLLFSLCGTVVLAAFWAKSDAHNDARYATKDELRALHEKLDLVILYTKPKNP